MTETKHKTKDLSAKTETPSEIITVRKLNAELEFRKHTSIIHYKGSLSSVDHRILNILYKCAEETDNFDSGEYHILISDICRFLSWDSGKFDRIKDALRKLRETGFEWNIFNTDKQNQKEWTRTIGTGFIADFDIDRDSGIISFSIGKILKKIIKNPNIYARIDLRIQQKLKGKHDLVLFEYFLEQLHRSKKREIRVIYSNYDFRKILNIPDDQYAEPKRFNFYCIKEPIASINANTHINIEIVNLIRSNRKIAAYEVEIKYKSEILDVDTKKDKQLQLELEIPRRDKDEDIPNYVIENYHNDDEGYDIVKELSLYFAPTTVNDLIGFVKNKWPEDYIEIIQKNLKFVKTKKETGTIQNFQGLLRTAIENDYANTIAAKEAAALRRKQDEENAKKRTEEKAAKKRLNNIKDKIINNIQTIFDQWPKEKQNEYIEKYKDTMDPNIFQSIHNYPTYTKHDGVIGYIEKELLTDRWYQIPQEEKDLYFNEFKSQYTTEELENLHPDELLYGPKLLFIEKNKNLF